MTFRQMVGYEYYEVSDSGTIRNRKTGTIRKQRDNTNGYSTVRIKAGGKQKLILVHRAVAEAFIPNPLGKECVNHIDGDKKNNNVANLEWVTHKENTEHAAQINLFLDSTT